MTDKPGLGHNMPPLEDRIFADPETTETQVIEMVMKRLKKQAAEGIAACTARAKVLASNSKAMPGKLDEKTVMGALELIAALDQHTQRVEEVKSLLVESIKGAADEANKLCKPMEAGLAPLEKSLRPMLIEYLTEQLDRHNAERIGDEPKLASFTLRGPSGSKASLTDGSKVVVTDSAAVPREFCVPDATLIDEAIKAGRKVPGTDVERAPTLRVTK